MKINLTSQNKNLLIISLIAMVNMLGYGIIIPIVYAYSQKFGLTDFQNGLLFAIYSVCQFISTPVIGRLSDKYGRRPMLILSIIGTAISFFIMAFAPSAIFLFLARALDGITAGNIPVAMAVVSDSTKPEERAKAFGMIGSAFNFGFVFGPAIAALTVGIWEPLPFVIAGVITVIAAVLTYFYLPETNAYIGTTKNERLFDFPKMWRTLFDKELGTTFVITLIFYLAFACAIIFGFQPYTLNILKLDASGNAALFTLFGVVGLIAQNFFVARFSKSLGMKKAFSVSILFTSLAFVIMGFSGILPIFIISAIILALFNSVVQTLIPTIISQEADEESQGSIMGLSASYQSIGMIFGPILGGAVATIAVPAPFVVGSLLILVCFGLSVNIFRSKDKIV
ncbi:MAG: MFS transporter [Candidatus Dojkabacteria bacterium]